MTRAPLRRLVEKHPLAIRCFHWTNLVVLSLMIWSGILIYWANPVYRIGWGSHTLLLMRLPPQLYQTLHINNRLAQGMSWHFFLMWLFAANGVLYVGYTVLSGAWRQLVPRKDSLVHALQTVLHDFHLRRAAPPLRRTADGGYVWYNGAQQMAYLGIVLAGMGSLLTGLAIYKPIQVNWLTALFGGYRQARFFHFWLTMGYLAFFVVHVGQVVRAGWGNFRAMVIGVDVLEEAASPAPPAHAPEPPAPTAAPMEEPA
jgi:thiosulfate reductase cytochrome b subunit